MDDILQDLRYTFRSLFGPAVICNHGYRDVSQRTPELGVRIALGATPRAIMKMILMDGARLGIAGVAIGIGLALLSARMLQGLLFGVTARDPLMLAAMTAMVAFATFVACYVPGRRAVKVDPMPALRAQ